LASVAASARRGLRAVKSLSVQTISSLALPSPRRAHAATLAVADAATLAVVWRPLTLRAPRQTADGKGERRSVSATWAWRVKSHSVQTDSSLALPSPRRADVATLADFCEKNPKNPLRFFAIEIQIWAAPEFSSPAAVDRHVNLHFLSPV